MFRSVLTQENHDDPGLTVSTSTCIIPVLLDKQLGLAAKDRLGCWIRQFDL